MKFRAIPAAILASLVPFLAQAQDAAPAGLVVRPVVGLMGTFGGDKLADVIYTDGTSSAVTAGGTAYLYAGAQFRPINTPVSVLATVGYHVSRAGGSNGDITFERIPVEVLGMFDVLPGLFRLGGGLRYDSNVNVNSSGVAAAPATKFDNKLGAVVQAEWMIGPHFGIVGRYVNMKYTLDDGTGTKAHVDGSHGGIGANWYF